MLPTLLVISEAVGGFTIKFSNNQFQTSQLDNMAGKNVIITGGNTGIGFETAKTLALAGANVILTTRSKIKGDDAVDKIMTAFKEANSDGPNASKNARVTAMICDQNSLKSVKSFATSFKKLGMPLHLLVLNAGIMKSPGAQFIGKNLTYGFGVTDDGFEQHIGVNHIAHQYMAQLLEDVLAAAAPESRIVSVSSSAHSGGFVEGIRPETWFPDSAGVTPDWYEDGIAYGQSKLANILFAREFASRMQSKGKGVSAYSLHPGVIQSELGRYMGPEFERDLENKSMFEKLLATMFATIWISSNMNVETGALTTLHVATASKDKLINGGFYWPIGNLVDVSHPAWEVGNESKNVELQKTLWTATEKAIQEALKRR